MIPLPAAPNSYHVIAWESFGLCCSLYWGTLCHCGMALQVWPPHLKACFRGLFACLHVWDVSAKCCSGGVYIYIWMCVTDVVRSHRSGVGWGVTAELTHLLQLARRSWGRRRERERDAQVINNVCWKRLAAHNSWCQRLDQSSRDN